MSSPTDRMLRRWRDRAAVRAEHTLEPTLRRRLDRLPQRLADGRALRAERRARAKGATAIDDAISRARGRALWRWDGS